jgi:peptide/nickel transport system permease protein
MNLAIRALRRAARTLLLLLVVAAGTMALVRLAPGFFSDERELDTRYAGTVRSELAAEQASQQAGGKAVGKIMMDELSQWINGNLGESRQYQVPVVELIVPRVQVSASLFVRAILYSWILAICAALPASAMRRGSLVCDLPFTLLLAMPTAAMATACILSGAGGPLLVLTLVIAARDFKFLRSVLRQAWRSSHLIQGRAQGLGAIALARTHIWPNVAPQLRALAALSIVTALGALIPLEVIFNVPGVGQLAWSAVMNRDLPVLAVVGVLMATVVAFAGMFSAGSRTLEPA